MGTIPYEERKPYQVRRIPLSRPPDVDGRRLDDDRAAADEAMDVVEDRRSEREHGMSQRDQMMHGEVPRFMVLSVTEVTNRTRSRHLEV